MKKLNMNGPGTIMLYWALLFLLIVPLILELLLWGFNLMFLTPIIKTSVAIGALIFLVLLVLVTIELKQDKRLNEFHISNKNRKVEISDSVYECPYCGSRKVKKEDRCCLICGGKFIN